ncbi:hypothetical protein J45TS6_29100 [Paenibacillus sp. J45TS6]|uniref:hypothetical protein n=1 Tax=Paenibacillus sp. J45TS6 TaxID=2807196 RepID=UPI001B0DB211|nr:hypothetical protein [Paenibacillus sp. J45TS6]GIP44451.1 hypothetical protein J45TS6_29100 [Paenibacillus sp. J45TS6]
MSKINILGFSISSNEIYVSTFNKNERSLAIEKFVLSNDSGESLRELYNYIQMIMKRFTEIERLILEVASNGQRSPSIERVKAEGIIDLAISDFGYAEQLTKIKTQKTKKKFKELPTNPVWVIFNKVRYSTKAQQVIAYLLLEELI